MTNKAKVPPADPPVGALKFTACARYGSASVRDRVREKEIAEHARRRDPRAGLGRGVRPSPISTGTRERSAASCGAPLSSSHLGSYAMKDALERLRALLNRRVQAHKSD